MVLVCQNLSTLKEIDSFQLQTGRELGGTWLFPTRETARSDSRSAHLITQGKWIAIDRPSAATREERAFKSAAKGHLPILGLSLISIGLRIFVTLRCWLNDGCFMMGLLVDPLRTRGLQRLQPVLLTKQTQTPSFQAICFFPCSIDSYLESHSDRG